MSTESKLFAPRIFCLCLLKYCTNNNCLPFKDPALDTGLCLTKDIELLNVVS